MTFAAEPYGVFVDDLLSNLTGGITREQFRYPAAEGSVSQLAFREDHVPTSVRLHGVSNDQFMRFLPGQDFVVEPDGVIQWLLDVDPEQKRARLPDRGSRYYVSYERRPESRPVPLLTDRNPGSVTRLLAESFAREFAVTSKQLETVYRGAYLETADDRDLDQVVSLVGVKRRSQLAAVGEVVFTRSSPAPADVFIPAGTRISTGDTPAITVETSEARTLTTGSLSVAVPVVSLSEGQSGIAKAGSLTRVHRPILGLESVTNLDALLLRGARESDESLRLRAARALEGGGAATVGALRAALTALEGITDKDVQIVEDHVVHPGLVKVIVATELNAEQVARAIAALESVRPAGIRILHNMPFTPPFSDGIGETSGQEVLDVPPITDGASEDVWFPIGVNVLVIPQSPDLTSDQRQQLALKVRQAIADAIKTLGIGEPVIYNALVARAMSVPGTADVLLDVFPAAQRAGRSNLLIPRGKRARLQDEALSASSALGLVALDLTIAAKRKGRLVDFSSDQALAFIKDDVVQLLTDHFAAAPTLLTQASLIGQLPETDDYGVVGLSYLAEFLEQGVRVLQADPEVALGTTLRGWVRSLTLTEVAP